jgi:hypothetical protein
MSALLVGLDGGGASTAQQARDADGERGGNPLLGIYTKSAAATPPDVAARLEKWELQSVSRQLLPKERVRVCMRHRRPGAAGVEVWHAPAQASAHYGGLMICGSVWHCPVCAAKIAERRREELAAAFASARAMGGRVVMATFTISHGRRDTLSGLLGRFLAAYRSMTSTRAYKGLIAHYGLVGSVKALETTVGGNGWHPHAHTAMFLPAEVDPAQLADDLYPVWAAAATRNGLTMTRSRGLDVTASEEKLAQYVAKWGHQPTRRLWDVEDELTRAHSKRGRTGEGGTKGATPFDLLRWVADTGESLPVALFREYAAEFKGRRQLVWSPGLRAFLGVDAEKTDEEIAGEIREDALLLALLSPAEWRAVRWADRRGQLLEVARSGDAGAVRAFVAHLVADQAGAESHF